MDAFGSWKFGHSKQANYQQHKYNVNVIPDFRGKVSEIT